MAKEWVAKLNRMGVLIGFNKNPVEIKDSDIVVPENCDLIPGKYRLVGNSFWPVEKTTKLLREKLAREVPECFYLLIKELSLFKIQVADPKIFKWMERYEELIKKEKI